jgi:hypothetical protein
MNKIEKLEGIITSVNLTGEVEKTRSYTARLRPYVSFMIKEDSGNESTFEIPISLPYHSSGIEMLRIWSINEEASCITEEACAYGKNYETKNITIKTGKLKGVEFEYVGDRL